METTQTHPRFRLVPTESLQRGDVILSDVTVGTLRLAQVEAIHANQNCRTLTLYNGFYRWKRRIKDDVVAVLP